MAGLDEAGARSALADMQDRLTRGPSVALGITASSTVEDARAAFLQLTKRYHPVRFGRMASDIQKQANEVFLALRAAHDTVAKTLRHAGASPAAPSLQAAAPGGAGNGRGAAAQGSPLRPLGGPAPATASTLSGSGPRPAVGRAPGAPGLQGPQVPHGSSSGAAPGGAIGGAGGAIGGAPGGAIGAGRAPGTARPAGSAPVTARDEAVVIDLLQRQQWDQARSALHQLSARDPNSRRIRALECYARGREAQLDRRLDDARVELQDALDLDPDLQLAKTALTELFTRRK